MGKVFYWPNAVADDGTRLFTSSSADSFESAVKQLEIWEDHYKYRITKAWIDSDDGTRYGMCKKWKIHAVSKEPAKALSCRWKVVMIRSGDGASEEYFDVYDEALKYAFAAKEDCESVSVYERENDGWKKAFNV